MPPEHVTLVIGAMKSGTTTLFHHLAQHPEIDACSEKEPEFFSHEENWERGIDWYLDLWPDHADEHRTALEATTAYTKRPRKLGVPRRIRQVADEHDLTFRFIYVLRDPLDRVISHMTHALAGGRIDMHHLHGIRRGSMEGHTLEVTMYARQLDAYLEHFDRDQILLTSFEAFVDDPPSVLEEITRFLDLTPREWGPPPEVKNRTLGKYEAGTLWTLLEETGLVRLADPVPESIKQPLRDLLGDEIDQKVEPSEELERFVLDALHHDMTRMRDEHGFDTDHWTWLEDLG